MKLLENKFISDINKDKQMKKDNDAKLLKDIDERIHQIKIELTRNKKIREEYDEKNSQELED